MNKSTKDTVKGKAHQAKGAVKEAIGKAIDSPRLQAEGQLEKQAGKIQQKLGHVEHLAEKK